MGRHARVMPDARVPWRRRANQRVILDFTDPDGLLRRRCGFEDEGLDRDREER